jgi:hypothetical protein
MNFDFTDIKEKYIDNVKLELEERWNKWNINFETRYINEVIMGILSRQSSLAIQIFSNPSIWNPEIAPIILRSMIENHLNLAWILLNKEENCQKFIEHGYGQMKLNLEHFKSKNTLESEEIQKYIELEEELINHHRYTFLTEVNIGSWSGISTREMAQKTGLIDFYNLTYQPFSNTAHSTWSHIIKHNIEISDNPLHKFIKKPIIHEYNPDFLHTPNTAGKYLDKSMSLFDKNIQLEITSEPSFDLFIKLVNEKLN